MAWGGECVTVGSPPQESVRKLQHFFTPLVEGAVEIMSQSHHLELVAKEVVVV
jgi:hypothetical protein